MTVGNHQRLVEHLQSIPFPASETFSLDSAIQRYDPPFLPPLNNAQHVSINLQRPVSYVFTTSHALNLAIANDSPIDILVLLSGDVFHHKDYLDYRYHLKCTIHLAHLNENLAGEWFILEHHIPSLLLEFEGNKYRLFCCIDSDVFNYSLRLAPSKNCIRPPEPFSEDDLIPTPQYNESLSLNLSTARHTEWIGTCLSRIPALADAVKIAKAWLYHLRLGRFTTRTSSFAMTMIACSLIDSPGPDGLLLDPAMDALQVFKLVLKSLDKEWTDQIVFKVEGVNVLTGADLPTMQSLAQEARRTLQSYDTIDKQMQAPIDLLDHYDATFAFPQDHNSSIATLLHSALKTRCSEIVVRHLTNRTLVSVRYIPTTAFALVEHGPIMSDKEGCDAFRKLWHSKSELRRFKDGAVREAVVWSCERHRIIEESVAHLMVIHHQLKMIWSSVSLFDFAMKPNPVTNSHVNDEFNKVTKLLRSIPEISSSRAHGQEDACLPLAITHCQPLYPAHRFADPHPGVPSEFNKSYVPPFCPAHPFLMEFESSNKWPTTLIALRASKMAFLIRLSELLHQNRPSHWRRDFLQHEYGRGVRVAIQAMVGEESGNGEPFLDISLITEGSPVFVFRAFVHVPREDMLMSREPPDVRTAYTFRHLYQRQLAIQGRILHDTNLVYGPTCRLAKRWLSCQLLVVPEELIERGVGQVIQMNPLHSVSAAFSAWLKHEPILDESFAISQTTAIRWKLLAKVCTSILINAFERGIQDPNGLLVLFTPNYADFDCLLHLMPSMISRHHQNINYSSSLNPASTKPSPIQRQLLKLNQQPTASLLATKLPGFDSISCLLTELKTVYSKRAEFFYNVYGGSVIAIRFVNSNVKRSELEDLVKNMMELGGGIIDRYEFMQQH